MLTFPDNLKGRIIVITFLLLVFSVPVMMKLAGYTDHSWTVLFLLTVLGLIAMAILVFLTGACFFIVFFGISEFNRWRRDQREMKKRRRVS